MDREEADLTPGEKWQSSLNATCNRLSTQYLTLLRAAAGTSNATSTAFEGGGGAGRSSTPQLADSSGVAEGHRAGGIMRDPNEPPPALAADAALNALQAKLAAQNLATASSHLLDLIRTLRLSALLMEEAVIREEEEDEYDIAMEEAKIATDESALLEGELMSIRQEALFSKVQQNGS